MTRELQHDIEVLAEAFDRLLLAVGVLVAVAVNS
jgi:hypothetical protein